MCRPGREPAQSTRAAQDYTLYTLEKALRSVCVGSDRDQLVFLVDFAGFRVSQVPSMDVSREVVQILNEHYTDILAKAYMLDAPAYLDGLWRIVKLMLHPLTASKVEFVSTTNPQQRSKLIQRIPPRFLEKTLGGTCEAVYDHEVYWEAEREYHNQIQVHTQQAIASMKQDNKFAPRTNTNTNLNLPPQTPAETAGDTAAEAAAGAAAGAAAEPGAAAAEQQQSEAADNE